MRNMCLQRTDRYDKNLEKFHVEYEEKGHVLDREKDEEMVEQTKAVTRRKPYMALYRFTYNLKKVSVKVWSLALETSSESRKRDVIMCVCRGR